MTKAYETTKIDVGDGVRMRAHIYPGGDKAPVVCIPGLTRNARDFDLLATKIAATGRNVIAVSLRGRADSDYDPNYLNYHPLTYRDDILKTLDALGIAAAVFVGTSLGGITTMLTNEAAPDRVKAAVINDVGPELAAEGIQRIAGYVGEGGPAADISEAAARIKAINEVAFPDETEEFWVEFARRTFKAIDGGKWVLDYDPNIAKAFSDVGPAPDLWVAFQSLKNTPTLILRGNISDLLTPEIIEKMREAHPSFEYAEVPRVGHAPMLTEPAAWRKIEEFLTNQC